MTTEQWTRVWTVLDRALDRPPAERRDWVETTCDDEPAVRAEVESLLAAYEPEDPLFSEEGAFSSDWFGSEEETETERNTEESAGVSGAGTCVGNYQLLEEIGVGGMSDVYRAERVDEAVEHTVAVKLMRRHLRTRNAEQRFRAERQVLASLDHPHIAQFVDGGVTHEGRPYLVMEYVEGVPLTDYAERHDLDVEARLDLLEQVLDAVQAAHRQLVVHRDLKPSNVLVTETTNGPRVTLLDFGIAKLLDDSLPVPRPTTRTGHRLLTPSYAAPEQLGEQDISTVTDVYQLGVLTYELLTGARPFDLEGKPPSEIETIVRTRSPSAPSESASPSRASRLRGDLDQIVQTALRKEPERRYASVEALTADLARYRRGEPIAAQPATLGYRARKFVTRNWVGVSVTASFLLMLALFIGLLVRQQQITAAERDRARQEAETAEQVSTFLASLFEANQPSEAQGDTLTAPELLERGVERAGTLEEQPVVQARMLHEMATSYRELGDYERAESLIHRALSLSKGSPDIPAAERAEHLNELGLVLEEQGHYPAADSVHRAALSIRTRQLGPNDPKTAESLNNLGIILRKQNHLTSADSIYREALAIRKRELGPAHPRTATTMNNLGIVLADRSQYAAADSLYREALRIRQNKLGPEHPDVAETTHNLAVLREEQGEYATADSLLQKTLAIERKFFGRKHPTTAVTLHNLGLVWEKRQKYAAAESAYRQSIAIERQYHDPDHPSLSPTYNNLGTVLKEKGDHAAADSLYQKALTIRKKHYGPEHPRTASTLSNVGSLYRERGQYAAADSVFRRTLAIRQQTFGKEHTEVAESQVDLARVRQALGRYEDAERLLHRALAIQRATLHEEHAKTTDTARRLAELYEEWNKPAQAKQYRATIRQQNTASAP